MGAALVDSGLAWHLRPKQELLQLVISGDFPWDACGGNSQAECRTIQRKMGIIALDIRAAEIDLELVRFEINSFRHSMQQKASSIQQALTAAHAKVQESLVQQDELLVQIEASTAMHECFTALCDLHKKEVVARMQCACIILLRKRLSQIQQQQQHADHLFEQYLSGDPAAAVFTAGIEQFVSNSSMQQSDDDGADGLCVDQECDRSDMESDPGDTLHSEDESMQWQADEPIGPHLVFGAEPELPWGANAVRL